MKAYKEYEKRIIGESDIATLILVGVEKENGLKLSTLNFGEEGVYKAYIVDENAIIGNHYTKIATFNKWVRIYDDFGLTYKIHAEEVNVFRAGEFGCIIQTIRNNKAQKFVIFDEPSILIT